MRRLSGLLFLVGVGAVLSLSMTTARGDVTDQPVNEKEWLAKAMACDNAEIKFSEIAVRRAESLKVKAYAEKMVLAHKRMNNKLEEVARNMNVAAAKLNDDQTGTIDGLSKLSGAEFDRAYITRMVQDHEKAVKWLENEAKNGTNPDLKRICNDALPHLQEHLTEARKIADELKNK